MNLISSRLLAQQLIVPQFSSPEELVEWFGAMQAQEYKLFRLAIAMRLKKVDIGLVDQALAQGELLRLHLNRATWQVVAKRDVRWMLDLYRESNLRTAQSYNKIYYHEVTPEKVDRSHRLLRDVLAGRYLSRVELDKIYEREGLRMDKTMMSLYLLRAEIDGIVCNGPIERRSPTYALLDEKVPPQPPMPQEEMLKLLAEKYFRSHGPATLDDFVWWAGLAKSLCQKGMHLLDAQLQPVEINGEIFWMHADARTRGFRTGKRHLLPSYDEYLIGYKSRHIVLAKEHTAKAHNNFGIFHPVILGDGKVVCNWKCTRQKGQPVLQQTYFDEAVKPDKELDHYFLSIADTL